MPRSPQPASSHLPEAPGRPRIIGLIGGIASGKSTVARLLATHGALVLDADQSVHEILKRPEVISAIVQHFSSNVITPTGEVDRKELARRVFGASAEQTTDRHWLENLLHPLVRERTELQIREADTRYPAIVIDAPLLLEAGWGHLCDAVLFVDTPWSIRCQLAGKRGWSQSELEHREQAQLPLADKRQQASDIVVNDGTLADLAMQVQDFWDKRVLAKPSA